ncbi:ELKS/Rab6-interacting/CAST family member 1 isoform X1, partial [Argonauta hians]
TTAVAGAGARTAVNELLQGDGGGAGDNDDGDDDDDADSTKQEQDKRNKELVILRKTVEEMEIRIATQKQTLCARDESIKKLLEMLQSKGLMVKQIDADRLEMETLRNTALEEETKRKQLEAVLEEKAKQLSKKVEENGVLSHQLQNAQFQMQSLPANAHTMQAMLEAKESRISALEKDIQLLEDKLLTLQEDISIGDVRSGKHSHLIGSKDSRNSPDIRTLKSQIGRFQEQLGSKETELCGLRLQLDTSEKQYCEQQEYTLVLKEQISARDHQISNITAEIDELRSRLKDKDTMIEKKSKQAHTALRERKKFEADLIDVKDSLDIKERKISVLQRKIQSVEDELEAKDVLLKTSQARLASALPDSDDKTLSSLEESLAEKDHLIMRLREQRERIEKESAAELDTLREQQEEHKRQIEKLNTELNDTQTQMCELREEASELRSQKMMSESMVNQLKMEMSDTSKDRQIEKLSQQLEEVKVELSVANSSGGMNGRNVSDGDKYGETSEDTQLKVTELETAVEEANKLNARKDVEIKELQDHIKEYRQKMGTLKRNQQTEKKKNAQMLEEARKREVLMDGDATQLKSAIKQMDDRVEELEEALRESVTITAEREMVMAEQESKIQQTEARVQELTSELDKMKSIQSEHIAKVGSLTRQLDEKDTKLRHLQSERHKQLEEVYEMKQEAIQATISEKDANIALLEMTSTKKQSHTANISKLEKEKEKLSQQLKELTESRMRLLQKKKEPSPPGSHKSLVHRMKGATDEQVIRAVRKIEHSKKRLRTLIDQLLAAVLDTDPQLLEGLPRIQQGPSVSVSFLRTLTPEQVRLELHRSDRDCQKLQDYANILLQRVGTSCPELLDNFVSMMESSDTESCQST